MAVCVELKDDESQHPKHNYSSSFWRKIGDVSETKKFSVLLVLALLINTIVIVIIAKNKTSNSVNELSIEHEESSNMNVLNNTRFFNELSGLRDEQLLSDQSLDINDDSAIETSLTNSEQNHYISIEQADEAAVVLDEINQAQENYESSQIY